MVFYYIYMYIYIHSSIDGHLSFFCILAVVNNAAIKIGKHVSFGIRVFVFFGYISRNGILGPMAVLYLIFWETSYACPQWLYQFTFIQHCRRVPFVPHPRQHFLFVFFSGIAILTGVRCYFIVVSRRNKWIILKIVIPFAETWHDGEFIIQ